MFERFTDRARRVVVLAQEEARLLNHNSIGTEHVLLGLIREREGVAATALESPTRAATRAYPRLSWTARSASSPVTSSTTALP
jgi:ATP-dependent Clp protease ATP-binding subunit ClpA